MAVAGLAAILVVVGLHTPGGHSDRVPPAGAAPKLTTEDDAGEITFGELAALALTEGIQVKDGGSSANPLSHDSQGDRPKDRQALFALLRTGSDADASTAIREFARLGGEANCKQLAAIMHDDGWSDAIRTEAALALLTTGNPGQAVLSTRVLGTIGGDANTGILSKMLGDTTLPQSLRVEAALALGVIGSPVAGDALVGAFGMFSDRDIHEQLLDTLGHFPFAQIKQTWSEFLNDEETPGYLRVAAVEALSKSTADAVEFLKSTAASDRDPNVREEAAWAISVLDRKGGAGGDLARMAVAEPEADVRRRLYEALLSQAANPAETLLPTIREETDLAARVAGFNALADAVKRGSSTVLASEFNGSIVRELTEVALSANTLNLRMRAVFALRRAGTVAADEALLRISQTENQKIAQAASHGLRTSK